MKSKYTRINFIITIVYILSIIYTALQLFSLQDELILGVSALTTDNISEMSSVLNTVYITVALSLIFGLVAILLNFKTEAGTVSAQHISHSNKVADKKVNATESQDSSDEIALDLSNIQKAIKNNTDKKDKYTAVLTAICKKVEAGQGAIYLIKESKGTRNLQLYASYAFHIAETETLEFAFGEGLIGQVAIEGNTLTIDNIPENYINIVSGLGGASPKHLLVTPLMTGKKIMGAVEIASFTPFKKEEEKWVKEGLSLLVGTAAKKVANNPKTTKTENKNE